MGAAGRERVAAFYSIHGWVDTIAEVLIGTSSPSRDNIAGLVEEQRVK
jgi:hypothetical protein